MSQEYVKVNEKELPLIKYRGKKLMNLADVKNVGFEKEGDSISVIINRDIKLSDDYKRFEQNKDYFVFVPDELSTMEEFSTVKYKKGTKKLIFLSKEGFKKIAPKHFKKISSYFTAKPYTKEVTEEKKPEEKAEVITEKTEDNNAPIVVQPATVDLSGITEAINALTLSQTKLQDALTSFIQIQTRVVAELNTNTNKSIKQLADSIVKSNEAVLQALTPSDTFVHLTGNGDYDTFTREIKHIADEVLTARKDKYKTRDDVLSACYGELRKVYGVVWEQDKHNFYEVTGRSPVNNLELVWWIEGNPCYKDLCKNRLLFMKRANQ